MRWVTLGIYEVTTRVNSSQSDAELLAATRVAGTEATESVEAVEAVEAYYQIGRAHV